MREVKFRAWIKYPYVYQMIYSGDDLGTFFDHTLYNKTYELMQYTGLKDREGKEIYEGDLCIVDEQWDGDYKDHGFVGVVRFEDGEFGVVGNGEYQYESLDFCRIKNRNIKIIGNLYEHPHLLTK